MPVLVEVMRGNTVESRHHGAFAVVDSSGSVLHSAGDIDAPIFPRSAIKPLQALPLIESGGAEALGLGSEQIALACASHRGEPIHVETVRAFLALAGLAPADLECGAHLPSDPKAAETLVCSCTAPSALHNNCSGKHTGFLATAKHLGDPTRGYIEWDHPVQQRVIAAVGEMVGLDLGRAPRGRDGCGIPTVAIPLRALAHASAKLADPDTLGADRGAAATRILDAMAEAPLMVSGTGTMTTIIMELAGSTVRLKPGAEGVFCAALPTLGLGVALKIEDGAKRGTDLAMVTLLDRLGCFSDDQRAALDDWLNPRILNAAGVDVGSLRVAAALDVV